jgi:predicted RNA-binding Zn ribbon-like protein
MRLVGGDIAVDFVNTLDPDVAGGDHLVSFAGFRVFAQRLELSAGRGTLAEVRAARARIEAVLRPLANGEAPPSNAFSALRDLETAALGRAALRPDGWRWPAGAALDRLVHAAVEIVVGDDHHRLRACPNCAWLFLDFSRNGSRRWCSMESCGTRVKARRLTERRRERRAVRRAAP